MTSVTNNFNLNYSAMVYDPLNQRLRQRSAIREAIGFSIINRGGRAIDVWFMNGWAIVFLEGTNETKSDKAADIRWVAGVTISGLTL